MIATLKQTPLYENHLALGAKIVEFAGWEMPVLYKSIIEEHHAVRKSAGLFDISHMGEFFVEGSNASPWLNTLLTNDVEKLHSGESQYTLLLNENGCIIDDLILYKFADEMFFLVVNASKIEEDFAWFQSKLTDGVHLTNASEKMSSLALQGPSSEKILSALFQQDFSTLKKFKITGVNWNQFEIFIARTGYTGEDGFELFFDNEKASLLWKSILETGKPYSCMPIGLGARDTLRLEACLPLNGHDLSSEMTPLEAGLEKFVCLTKKTPFIGQASLEKNHSSKKSVAFIMQETCPPPRQHYPVWNEKEKIGEVTSGGVSPTLQKNIGMALVNRELIPANSEIFIEIRGKKNRAAIFPKPLYKKGTS